jgi:ferredoxin
MASAPTYDVRVYDGTQWHRLEVEDGTVLRDALLTHDLSPYTALTEMVNCGGRGLCATCGVRLAEGVPASHWHDRAAQRFGYPRLSCQIRVRKPLTVYLDTDKWIWGRRRSNEPSDAS